MRWKESGPSHSTPATDIHALLRLLALESPHLYFWKTVIHVFLATSIVAQLEMQSEVLGGERLYIFISRPNINTFSLVFPRPDFPFGPFCDILSPNEKGRMRAYAARKAHADRRSLCMRSG